MLPQILVPLDGSALAEIILPHAQLLAGCTGRELLLAQAVALPESVQTLIGPVPPVTVLYETWEAEMTAATRYLASVATRLEAAGQRTHTAVLTGPAAPALVAYAAQHAEVQGLAMATHGRSGLRRWVFGSTAEEVLHATHRPLLLVRPEERAGAVQGPPARPYHTIIVPLDGSPLAEAALTAARPLAAARGATLVLVFVVDEPDLAWLATLTGPDEPALPRASRRAGWAGPARPTQTTAQESYLTDIAARLRTSGYTVQTQLHCGYPAEAILDTSEALDADLIVMATHGRGSLGQWLFGSVALKVVQAAHRPVLLVRDQAAPPAQAG